MWVSYTLCYNAKNRKRLYMFNSRVNSCCPPACEFTNNCLYIYIIPDFDWFQFMKLYQLQHPFCFQRLSDGFFPSQLQPRFQPPLPGMMAFQDEEKFRSSVHIFWIRSFAGDNKKMYSPKNGGWSLLLNKNEELENLTVKPIFCWRSLEANVLCIFNFVLVVVLKGDKGELCSKPVVLVSTCIYRTKSTKQVIQVAATNFLPSLQRTILRISTSLPMRQRSLNQRALAILCQG